MIVEFSNKTGFSVEDILGGSRKMELVAARQLYWKLLRKNGFSLLEIANITGFGHANVTHGIRVASERLEIKDAVTCSIWEKVKDIDFEI
ncbi:MAG: hypothetical protein VB054_00720 [Petrimonas sp.]|nr:hypothetical protein [Petrimonas sp.]